MVFGLLKDIKNGEYRTIATPAEIATIVADGHTALVQRGAGEKAGFEDQEYEKAGARLVDTMEDIYGQADFVTKVKELEPCEFPLLRKGQIIFTCIHPAAHPQEVQAILDEAGCGLIWACNGHLTHLSKPTTLELDRVEDGRAFNINPAGLNKGVAIARFCEHLGIEREETLALGDSESDFYMADHVGTFCLVENGLTSAGAPEFLAACENAFVTRGKIVDGWAATAELLVAARS